MLLLIIYFTISSAILSTISSAIIGNLKNAPIFKFLSRLRKLQKNGGTFFISRSDEFAHIITILENAF